jgi:chaperonin GroES
MATKKLNYELYDDRVLVKPAAAETKTAGGIIIPDSAKEKPQKGTVVAAGPGKYAEQTGNIIPVKQKVGDVILYGKYAGTEITIDGEEYLIMRTSDILMKAPQ